MGACVHHIKPQSLHHLQQRGKPREAGASEKNDLHLQEHVTPSPPDTLGVVPGYSCLELLPRYHLISYQASSILLLKFLTLLPPALHPWYLLRMAFIISHLATNNCFLTHVPLPVLSSKRTSHQLPEKSKPQDRLCPFPTKNSSCPPPPTTKWER